MDTDSDSDDCQQLKLSLPAKHVRDLENQKTIAQPQKESGKVKYDFDFSQGPFVNKQNTSGFGDCKEEPPNKFLESNVLFNALSCAENQNENDLCILRLNDLLANIDLSIETMSKELIKYGKILSSKNFEQLHLLGFADKYNKNILSQNILSLQASLRLLHADSEDLQTLLSDDPPKKRSFVPTKNFLLPSGLLVLLGGLVFAWKNLPSS